MNLLRILFFALFVGATCSAQHVLPIGKHLDDHIGFVSMNVGTARGFNANGKNGWGKIFEYDRSAPFLQVLEQKLRSETLKPYKGEENSKHAIFVTAYVKDDISSEAVVAVSPENDGDYFFLEQQDGRWVIPEESLKKALNSLRYPGEIVYRFKGITGFEASMWRNGELVAGFSTVTGENTWDNLSCQIPAILADIADGRVSIPRELVVPNDQKRRWDEVKLTFLGGENFVTVDGDGYLLKRSVELPSFIPPIPLALAVERVGSSIEVSLTGEGADTATIEESEDLVTWAPPYSLTPLPETPLSFHKGGRHYVVTTPVTQRLYRVRPPSVEPQTRN